MNVLKSPVVAEADTLTIFDNGVALSVAVENSQKGTKAIDGDALRSWSTVSSSLKSPKTVIWPSIRPKRNSFKNVSAV